MQLVPVIVLCFFAACVFASCTKKHLHEYGDWTIVREADCETVGLQTCACNGCKKTEQETIKAKGHTIKEGNLLEIVPEGNVVYRYYEENGENEYIRGALNDNEMFYLYMVQTDDSGAVAAEHLIFAYVWIEKDGVITVYENEVSLIKGTIVNGYLVIDY